LTKRELDALASLRLALDGAGYTDEALGSAAGAADDVTFPELRPVAAEIALDEHADLPLGVLGTLFTWGVPVAERRFAEALPELDVAALVELELLEVEDSDIVPLARIDELDGLYVVAELETDLSDSVAGVSWSGLQCAVLTPRSKVERALDIGTGSGMQALLCARHARQVVATDVNPDALRLTALGAALNGFDNVETREGSYLEPVDGERFDLIVANPPYVIGLERRIEFRDSGAAGDELSRELLGAVPDNLEEGGIAVLQGQWVHGADSSWWSTAAGVLAGRALDGYLIRSAVDNPVAHAATWFEDDHADDPEAYAVTIDRWLEVAAASGIEQISTAVAVIRRREAAARWFRAVTHRRAPGRLRGHDMDALFATQDLLEENGADPFVQRVSDLRIERRLGPSGERWFVDSRAALGGPRPCSAEVAALLAGLEDGARLSAALRSIPPALAEELRGLCKLGYLQLSQS
jgi:SAM-dependent methyltransferase